jgi:hypothetical protein
MFIHRMWVLQENEQGNQFWDSYLHPECQIIDCQKEYPFLEGEK